VCALEFDSAVAAHNGGAGQRDCDQDQACTGDAKAIPSASMLQSITVRSRVAIPLQVKLTEEADSETPEAEVQKPSASQQPVPSVPTALAQPDAFSNSTHAAQSEAVMLPQRIVQWFVAAAWRMSSDTSASEGRPAVAGFTRWSTAVQDVDSVAAALAVGVLIGAAALVAVGVALYGPRRAKQDNAARPSGEADTSTVIEWAMLLEFGAFGRRPRPLQGQASEFPTPTLSPDGFKLHQWSACPQPAPENSNAQSPSQSGLGKADAILAGTLISKKVDADSEIFNSLKLPDGWEPESEI